MNRKYLVAGLLSAAALTASVRLGAQVPAASPAPGNPTFSKDVAPILYRNCTNCHRAGEIGPMALITYSDARPWAKSIAAHVANKTMPPWHADSAHGQFLNDRSLSDADRTAIVKWVAAGAPEGDHADLPKAPTFADGWLMGQPDAVFAMQEDYPIPAAGTIEYKYFEVPTNLTEDKWVQAVEVRPGDRSAVHHVIVYMRTPPPAQSQPAQAQPQARQTPPFTFGPGMRRPEEAPKTERGIEPNDRPVSRNPGAWLTGFAPGQSPRVYQPGTALRVPAGAVLTVAMHYTANGHTTTDRTRIGLKYATEKPKTEIIVATLQNMNFRLPAGAADTRVDAELTRRRILRRRARSRLRICAARNGECFVSP
jgi:hypothetical protein